MEAKKSMMKFVRSFLSKSFAELRAHSLCRGFLRRNLHIRAQAPSSGLARGAAVLTVGALTTAGWIATKEPVRSDDMEPWEQRWIGGEIGFHMEDVNYCLLQFFRQLLDDSISAPEFPKRILVPLCGKTVDMAFMQSRGHKVTGIDGVRLAAEQYITEQGMKVIQTTKQDGFEVLELQHGNGHTSFPMRFVVGDFFRIRPSVIGTFEACWDRGSLVAIDPPSRKEYVAAITAVLEKGARILLVVVEHPPMQGGKLGPPFTVTGEEVEALYGKDYQIELLQREDRMGVEPRWRQAGCDYYNEVTYLLTKRR
mmetsp:Transcript_74826/g.200606  ORF Transcript_74826/g.200606 Transcript_74826/m.200606 type:complete len:310 (-) Transcript_74826:305-1234(-)